MSDAVFTLQDDGDATKQARFDASALATGTTRTYTLPKTANQTRYVQTFPFAHETYGFIRDDFFTYATGNGQIGELKWNSNGGTSTVQTIAGRFGVIRRDTGATANVVARINIGSVAASTVVHLDDTFDITWIVRVNQTDTDFTIRAGLDGNFFSSNPDANGIYFERIGGASADSNWFGVTRSGSTQTRVDTQSAISTNWVTLRARRVDASTIGFSVDGGTEVTNTTNIPSVAAHVGLHIINLANASKTVDVDYFSLLVTGLSR